MAWVCSGYKACSDWLVLGYYTPVMLSLQKQWKQPYIVNNLMTSNIWSFGENLKPGPFCINLFSLFSFINACIIYAIYPTWIYILYRQQEFRQDTMIAEWLAVFYPHKFCGGQVIDLTKNSDLTIEFLDRCPGEVFVDWSDTEQVERKYVLLWKTTATLKRTTSTKNVRKSTFLKERWGLRYIYSKGWDSIAWFSNLVEGLF